MHLDTLYLNHILFLTLIETTWENHRPPFRVMYSIVQQNPGTFPFSPNPLATKNYDHAIPEDFRHISASSEDAGDVFFKSFFGTWRSWRQEVFHQKKGWGFNGFPFFWNLCKSNLESFLPRSSNTRTVNKTEPSKYIWDIKTSNCVSFLNMFSALKLIQRLTSSQW